MPADDGRLTTVLKQTRQTLQLLGRLYEHCAADCVREIPQLLEGGPQQFADTLRQYLALLVVKLSADMMQADWKWSLPEREVAAEVLEHLEGRRLSGEQLEEAWKEWLEKVAGLTLEPLLRPFARLAPLQRRAADLESLVLRLANLVAKADGHVDSAESLHLLKLQDELERFLEKPLKLSQGASPTSPVGPVQVAQQPSEARREGPLLTAAPPPLPGKQSSGARGGGAAPLPAPAEVLATALADLDRLVGLAQIKREVLELSNFLKIQAERARQGLPLTPIGLHMVFRGNPGTGKTTVARIVGRILGALGVVSRGHVVETDRSGLVAEFAGQTGPKTHKKVDEALDGILFIDEAYSLVAESGDDPFGLEAVQALLKRMEDDRHRLVVILAGYSQPMDELLQSNPGLTSRFQRHLNFPDYSPGEMLDIFLRFCQSDQYQLPAEARLRLLEGFADLLAHKDEHFGNGRLVRNAFEAAIRRQANRLATVAPLTEEVLTTLSEADVRLEAVQAALQPTERLLDWRLTVTCTGCGAKREMPGRYLTRRVRCPACQHQFRAELGEPLVAGEPR